MSTGVRVGAVGAQRCTTRTKTPCIPTIDVVRKDVLRIDEGSKGDEEDGLLKFYKVISFGKAIGFIEQAYSQVWRQCAHLFLSFD